MSSMPCNCGAKNTIVIDSRLTADGQVRRRHACKKCDARFTTYEMHSADFSRETSAIKLVGDLVRVLKELANVLPGAHADIAHLLEPASDSMAGTAIEGSQPAADRGAREDHGRAADPDAAELPGDRGADGPDASFGELGSAAAVHAAAGGGAGTVDR